LGAEWEWSPYDIDEFLEENLDEETKRRAVAAARSGRLVRISDSPPLYIFMGEHGDHIIVDGVYCTCEAFYFSSLRGRPHCYHVYAARLEGGSAKTVDLDVDEVIEVVEEVMNVGFSVTLRKILYTTGLGEESG
jgi:predicted nucleic acid-binding Zn finger protein